MDVKVPKPEFTNGDYYIYWDFQLQRMVAIHSQTQQDFDPYTGEFIRNRPTQRIDGFKIWKTDEPLD